MRCFFRLSLLVFGIVLARPVSADTLLTFYDGSTVVGTGSVPGVVTLDGLTFDFSSLGLMTMSSVGGPEFACGDDGSPVTAQNIINQNASCPAVEGIGNPYGQDYFWMLTGNEGDGLALALVDYTAYSYAPHGLQDSGASAVESQYLPGVLSVENGAYSGYWTVQSAPEPGDFGLMLLGLGWLMRKGMSLSRRL
jgi:hypothetical protein